MDNIGFQVFINNYFIVRKSIKNRVLFKRKFHKFCSFTNSEAAGGKELALSQK